MHKCAHRHTSGWEENHAAGQAGHTQRRAQSVPHAPPRHASPDYRQTASRHVLSTMRLVVGEPSAARLVALQHHHRLNVRRVREEVERDGLPEREAA
eukprot:61915-Chlamydomonas_euryale.AAC.1